MTSRAPRACPAASAAFCSPLGKGINAPGRWSRAEPITGHGGDRTCRLARPSVSATARRCAPPPGTTPVRNHSLASGTTAEADNLPGPAALLPPARPGINAPLAQVTRRLSSQTRLASRNRGLLYRSLASVSRKILRPGGCYPQLCYLVGSGFGAAVLFKTCA